MSTEGVRHFVLKDRGNATAQQAERERAAAAAAAANADSSRGEAYRCSAVLHSHRGPPLVSSNVSFMAARPLIGVLRAGLTQVTSTAMMYHRSQAASGLPQLVSCLRYPLARTLMRVTSQLS